MMFLYGYYFRIFRLATFKIYLYGNDADNDNMEL